MLCQAGRTIKSVLSFCYDRMVEKGEDILNTAIKKLYDVQELDQEVQSLKKKKEQIKEDPEREELKKRLSRTEEALSEDEKTLARTVKELHRKELDLQQTSEKKEEIRRKLYDGSVTSMKEMEKMTRMNEELDEKEDDLENSILTLMMTVEEKEESVGLLKKEVKELGKKFEEDEKQAEKEMQQIDQALMAMPEKKEEMYKSIPKELVDRYEEVSKRRQEKPVALVKNKVCTGCRVGISVFVMRELKKGDRPIQCESCGRILYLENEQEREKAGEEG